MSSLPYVIAEVANVHAGDFNHVLAIIERFGNSDYPKFGLKFQVLKADAISEKEYEWYSVYKELEFAENEWQEVLSLASQHCDVWLDIFDTFGVLVFEQNLEVIKGIKFQASIVQNEEIISALKSIDVSNTKLIINISGYEISEIEDIKSRFELIGFSELIFQVGFQAYPTNLSDCSLNKINEIKNKFSGNSISIADHVSIKQDVCVDVPVWASLLGANFVEKHICLNREQSKYDFHSALEPVEFKLLLEKLMAAHEAIGCEFISNAEKSYLEKTMQIPLVNRNLSAGELVSSKDVRYRRTAKTGITWNTLRKIQTDGFILSQLKSNGDAFKTSDFKKARIATIVACRLKSSRLKNKALLNINGKSSIQHCLESCKKLPKSEFVVLATSNLEEDYALKSEAEKCSVEFWTGSAEDVVERYIQACDYFGIDIVYRVTGDCPFVSSEVAEILVESHFENGADYTFASNAPTGVSLEIYNASALRQVLNYFGNAEHSEYMTWYLKNNSHVFKVNEVTLPKHFESEARMTLDYQEDLLFFRNLFEELERLDLKKNIKDILAVLNSRPDLLKVNQACTLIYKTDAKLIAKLDKETKMVTKNSNW